MEKGKRTRIAADGGDLGEQIQMQNGSSSRRKSQPYNYRGPSEAFKKRMGEHWGHPVYARMKECDGYAHV